MRYSTSEETHAVVIAIRDLAEYFAKYVFLPRLKPTELLLNAISNGVQSIVWEEE